MNCFLGIDVGSVSTNIVLIDENDNIIEKNYSFTQGQVLNALKRSFKTLRSRLSKDLNILGVGVTGSGGELASAVVNADLYKTEIFSHAIAAIHEFPDVSTIFEIGGQDSKVIYIKNGTLESSKMNEWCGAGTGSMLDAQSARLGIPVERLGELAVKAKKAIDFRTRCGVFIESCAINAQARGYPIDQIASGLCHACAKSFFNTLHIDRKSLKQPIIFQGGVAANLGMKKALEKYINDGQDSECELLIPQHYNVMGALGISLSVKKAFARKPFKTKFRGFDTISNMGSRIVDADPTIETPNRLINEYGDILELTVNEEVVATL